MKNDIFLMGQLKVLQQKLLETIVPNKKNLLNESSLSINDISGTSTMNGKGKPLKDDKYFILHHTAGRSSASGVVGILNKRRLGVQWVIDREGDLYQTLPKGSFGQHVAPNKGSAPSDMSNRTSQGVEIVGSNDNDILIKQCKTALLLIKDLGYPLSNVYGHGEVQSNKQATEGQKCKRYATKYWDTPEDELPDVDEELGKDVEDVDNKSEKKDKSDKIKTDNEKDDKLSSDEKDTEKDTEKKDTEKKDVKVKTTNPFDAFKMFGGIVKESKELKKQEELERIKKLLK